MDITVKQAIANSLRTAYNVDIEITAVFSNTPQGEKKVGYRYLISKWNKDEILERNIYSPGEHIYLTYYESLCMALERCKEELDLPPDLNIYKICNT